jgi:hypothetical protein
MNWNFTTARDLVDLKIKRNEALIELFDTESIILKKGILINYRWVLHNEEKVKLINEINEIENKQRDLYCPDRQELIKNLTERVNEISVDIQTLQNEIFEAQQKCRTLLEDINNYNSKIPHQTIVTNYRIPIVQNKCKEL